MQKYRLSNVSEQSREESDSDLSHLSRPLLSTRLVVNASVDTLTKTDNDSLTPESFHPESPLTSKQPSNFQIIGSTQSKPYLDIEH